MKTLTQSGLLSLVFVLLTATLGWSQISYRLGYEEATQTYRVYMTSARTFTGNSSRIATAQVTLLLPHGEGTNRFTIRNLHGKMVQRLGEDVEMTWNASSRADAPREAPSADIQSFGYTNSSGLQFDMVAGVEIELFSFQNASPCGGSVRLIANSEPFAANIPNSVGATAGNAFYIQGVRGSNVYVGNYGSAAPCSPQPDLALSISGPGTLSAGVTTSYAISVSNVGNATTSGAMSLTTLLPVGLSYVGSLGADWNCAPSTLGNGNTQVVCSSNAVLTAGAASQYTIQLSAAANVSTALFSAGVLGGGDLNVSNNTASRSLTVGQASTGSVDVVAQITGQASLTAGGTASYVLSLTNLGTGSTTGSITASISLATGLTYSGFTGAGWNVLSSTVAGVTVLNISSSAILTANGVSSPLVLNIGAAAGVSNSVGIISGLVTVAGDVNVVNNVLVRNVTLVAAQQNPNPINDPSIRISLIGSTSLTVGVQSSYTLSLTNTGTGPTTGPITATISLPAGVTFAAPLIPGWSYVSALQANGTLLITATFANTVAANTSVTPFILNLLAFSSASTTVNITGGVTTINNITNVNNTFNVSINVAQSTVINGIIDLSTRLTGPGIVTPGQPLTFVAGTSTSLTLLVTNVGSGSGTVSPTTQTTLPAGFTFNGAIGIGWTVSTTLVNGVTVVLATFNGIVLPNATLPALVLNLTASSTLINVNGLSINGFLSFTGEINVNNNIYIGQLIVIPQPATGSTGLTTRVIISNQAPNLFGSTTISIVVSNTSSVVAQNVVSQITIPAGYPVISQVVALNTNFVLNTGIWNIGTLQPGQSLTLTLTVSAATGGVVTVINTVTALNLTVGLTAHSCFTVPVQLCPGTSLSANVPASFTGVQWFRNGGQTAIASGNILIISEPGSYVARAPGLCPGGDCCALIVSTGDCCVQSICIPLTVRRTR